MCVSIPIRLCICFHEHTSVHTYPHLLPKGILAIFFYAWMMLGQVEPSLAVLRGSAFLAINDEYVEFSDIISLKVPS